jgi:uncharacterized repeat protein (TIGR01451 family)
MRRCARGKLPGAWVNIVTAVAALLIATPVFAVPVRWTLNGVTFDDGGMATGSFDFDADSSTLSNWNIGVSGGNTGSFPVLTYSTADASSEYYLFTGNTTHTIQFDLSSSDRQLRLTPVSDLTNAGGTVAIDLATAFGGSGGVECFNCSPFRLINAGSFSGVAPATISKAFGDALMRLGTPITLTLTIGNPNATAALTGISVTDTLPAGMVVSQLASNNTCGGTLTAVGDSVSLSGGSLPPGGSCTVTVLVVGTTVGPKDNTMGPITSNEAGAGGTASASTIVNALTTAPVVSLWGLAGLVLLLGAVAWLSLWRPRLRAPDVHVG